MLFSLTDSIFLILPPRLVVEAQGGMQSWIFIYLSLFYPEQSLYSNSVLWDKQSTFQTFSSPQQDGILEEQIKLQFQVASLSWVSSKAMYIIFVIWIWYYFIKEGSPHCVRPLRMWLSPEAGFHEVGERDSCTCMHVALLFWILSLFGNDLSLSTWNLVDMWPSAAEVWDGDLEPLLLVPPRTNRVSHNCPSHLPVVTCFSFCGCRNSHLLLFCLFSGVPLIQLASITDCLGFNSVTFSDFEIPISLSSDKKLKPVLVTDMIVRA